MIPERGPQTESFFARSAEKLSFARSALKNEISLRAKRGKNYPHHHHHHHVSFIFNFIIIMIIIFNIIIIISN